MALPTEIDKSLLQRRSNFGSSFQAAADGLSIILLTWVLVLRHIGFFSYDYVILLLTLMGSMALVYDNFNVYQFTDKFGKQSLQLFKAWTLAFVGLILLGFLTKQSTLYSRSLVLELYISGFLIQLLIHIAIHWVQIKIATNPDQLANVVIVGQGRLANYLHRKITTNTLMGEKVVGSISYQSYATINPEQTAVNNVPLLGDLDNLPKIIEQYDIKTVYIVTPLSASGVIQDIYAKLMDKHVTVHWIPDIYGLRLVNHSFTEIAGLPVLTLSETPLVGFNKLMKETEDILLASVIFVLILPILFAVGLAVKLDSPGPVFFRQNRAGWNGKTFRIWKFRSMYVHQEDAGKVKQAQKDDPRITRVGKFIRRTSLDELPQILNVLSGDMSLVGPRPHAIQHDEEYSKRISDYFARHHIKPGITGLAQVRGLRGETTDIDQMVQRIESDIEYINNWSVWLDLTILLRTVTAFTGKNAY